MTAPRTPGSAALVRLVAGREVSTRIRDKTFLISSAVILLLVLGGMVFQVLVASGANKVTVGVVGERATLQPALVAQGKAVGADVTVVGLADEAAARTALASGDVDGALVGGLGAAPRLLVQRKADTSLTAAVEGAVDRLALSRQLAAAGIPRLDVPKVGLTTLHPGSDPTGERTGIAVIGVVVLYSLLIMMGQFIAQGVVEEKSTRVVELLLATMRPWQLLAGKIIGLGLLGLAQIVGIAVIGVSSALAFDVVTLPGQLVGTAVSVVAWFVLGYAFYAAVFAGAASLVSRQEDLPSVITPMTLVLVVGFVVAIQSASNPGGTLARVTSFIPGLSPMVMPIRLAGGGAAWWEVVLAVGVMLVAIVAVVRLGGRIYAGALLRTSGKTKLREALRAERL
ncbi:MAG: type transport system permease protein [Blastococcus sp.]|nr:type transport system permease protein [Blastococcus sp.]